MPDYSEVIERYSRLQDACYELAKQQLKAEGHWLTIALCNASSGDLKCFEQNGDRITFTAVVWTSQTGGSYEHLDFSFSDSDVMMQVLKMRLDEQPAL